MNYSRIEYNFCIRRITGLIGCVWLSLFFADTLNAQLLNVPDEKDEEGGVHYSIVPMLGYSSDTGLLGGGLMQRFNYGDGVAPFLSNLRLDAVFSTRGDIITELNYQRTRSFGTDIRSEISLIGEWYRQAHYFGIGNETTFSNDLYDENYFFYEKKIFDVLYRARKTVAEYGFEGKFDLYGEVGLSLMDASERNENSLFAEELPFGENDNRVGTLGFGVIAEDRDSEFNPTEGYRYEAGIESSGAFTFSEYDYNLVHAELRHYFELFEDVILAQKITGVHLFGSPPFWKRPAIGDKYGLRGFHENRFIGDSSILHVLELRTWIFSLFDDELKLGGQAFWDSGRVFTKFDSNGFFDGWKHSWGVGGAISIFNPDFILRGDLGFSSEAMRIYAGVGYLF